MPGVPIPRRKSASEVRAETQAAEDQKAKEKEKEDASAKEQEVINNFKVLFAKGLLLVCGILPFFFLLLALRGITSLHMHNNVKHNTIG